MKQFLVFRHILILRISPFRLSKISAICSLCMGRSAPLASPVDEDPLTLALAPPPDETYEQRLVREAAEVEAKRISDEIDEQLRRERELEKKKKKPIKLLLLGQSESGKSATLKNFQLTYTRREWSEERASWRAVIYLNLVRNVNRILNLLARETSDRSAYNTDADISDDSTEELLVARARSLPPLKFKEKHRLLQQRLRPLLEVQMSLEQRLGAGAMEMQTTTVTSAAPFDSPAVSKKRGIPEFGIHSSNGWKSALGKLRIRTGPRLNEKDVLKQANDLDDDLIESLVSCREVIKELWDDAVVQEMLNSRKIRIEDSPGFFLNDAERIASWNYQPTDDDVIRARLRTLGVQEHQFVFDHGRAVGQEWRMYDVGGTRNSRAAWYPYFDDVDAIIFLAPISPFDEKLAEDKRVNRLEDSFLLWRSVCANKLLARTQLILFLNKCDLLQAKLQRGIRIRDSVPSFGDRKNDFSSATKYFQQHFREIAKQSSSTRRSLFIHLTSVIDTRATAVTLGAVEECILREHLRKADLM
ncbi:Guanine nucleotide binding protein (G-protein), alpha subunit [Amanita muscaria]